MVALVCGITSIVVGVFLLGYGALSWYLSEEDEEK